jgi:AcrR family transcriptional regulator
MYKFLLHKANIRCRIDYRTQIVFWSVNNRGAITILTPSVDKKDRVLDSARGLFISFGVKNTTVEQIAKAAKVGKGTVYLYFHDKETLFVDVMDLEWNRLCAEMSSELAEAEHFLDRIQLLLTRVTAFRQSNPLFQKAYQEFALFGTPEIDKSLKRIQHNAIELVNRLVDEGMRSGQFPNTLSSQMLAFLLVKAYAAFMNEWPKEFEPLGQPELSKLLEVLLKKEK